MSNLGSEVFGAIATHPNAGSFYDNVSTGYGQPVNAGNLMNFITAAMAKPGLSGLLLSGATTLGPDLAKWIYDKFTSDPKLVKTHRETVEAVWQAIADKADKYLGDGDEDEVFGLDVDDALKSADFCVEAQEMCRTLIAQHGSPEAAKRYLLAVHRTEAVHWAVFERLGGR